jgi:glycerol uptake operon antiterminator
MAFLDILKKKPVIAALRDVEHIPVDKLHKAGILFVLGGTIFDIPALVEATRRLNQLIFIDIDLIKGVGKDHSGIRYLAKAGQVHGIITTKSNLTTTAKENGLATVQRIFVLDSESLMRGLNVVSNSKPDAVELLPGLIVPKIINRIRTRTSVPIIAGGLITESCEVEEILASGAVGVSTTSYHLLDKTTPIL